MADMIHKDTQMSDILRRDDMTNDQKQKLYNANLERYLELRQQKDSEISSVRVVGKKEEEQQPPQPQQEQLADTTIVEPIPKTMRDRATALLNRLKTRSDLISWDKSGQVKIEGETIPDSNISDLVSDALRSRKGFNPAGAKEFFQTLSKMNMPKDLVRNQQRWKQMVELKDIGTPQQSFDTPSTSEGFHSVLRSYTPKQWLNY